MLKISIITLFPELHDSFLKTSIIGRAIESEKLSIETLNLIDFCMPKVRVDAPTVGPGPGMVIKPEIIAQAIEKAESSLGKGLVIFMSPSGQLLTQQGLRSFAEVIFNNAQTNLSKRHKNTASESNNPHLIIICSRYEGVDQRAIEKYCDIELSIGNYVLMGGDLPAQVFIEGLCRLIPGILGNSQSTEEESFSQAFLDHPHYCLPAQWGEKKVPSILLSGNHSKIAEWRESESLEKTIKNRFDVFKNQSIEEFEDAKNKGLLEKALNKIPKHYVALMHTGVLVEGKSGDSSITSIDIQDLARSCATFGISNLFIVTRLEDQAKLANQFVDFWMAKQHPGILEKTRTDALGRTIVINSLESVISKIKEVHGKDPIIIATSAKTIKTDKSIGFSDQSSIWRLDRPILFVFGTAGGLSQETLDRCDKLLLPICGLPKYNHLSVRSAVGIILDRWIGIILQKKNDFYDFDSII